MNANYPSTYFINNLLINSVLTFQKVTVLRFFFKNMIQLCAQLCTLGYESHPFYMAHNISCIYIALMKDAVVTLKLRIYHVPIV